MREALDWYQIKGTARITTHTKGSDAGRGSSETVPKKKTIAAVNDVMLIALCYDLVREDIDEMHAPPHHEPVRQGKNNG
jgi:hypothetical protein